MNAKEVLIAIVLIALGISFAYKCVQAVFFGKTTYWTGFLPLSVISPFFIHWKPGKNSLIKTTHHWWVHITLGPAFFLSSLLLLANGADRLGWPGTQMANTVLTLGRKDVPSAITVTADGKYQFPIARRVRDAMLKLLATPAFPEEGNKHPQ